MKKKLLTGLLALTMAFSLVPMSGTVWADDTVTFLNDGYPYGKNMTDDQITLVMDVEDIGTSYQWQVADSKEGDYSDIVGADSSTYTFEPETGMWYRCVVDDTESKAVQVVYPEGDDRNWTGAKDTYYISNGTMAYMANGSIFDVAGLYVVGENEFMLNTTYASYGWALHSSSEASPTKERENTAGPASLDALRIAFNEENAYDIIFEVDLADGQQSFGFGSDSKLGNYGLFGDYADAAVLQATVEDGQLKQISMVAAASLSNLTGDEGAFVISPVTENCIFWIGGYSERRLYGYNTSTGDPSVIDTAVIGGENVVTRFEGEDSGMVMSWTGIPSGGSIKFGFGVGTVASTGAAKITGNASVDYTNETITGLDANTTYNVTSGNVTYSITSDSNGTISLTGTDNNGKAYDFIGKTISLVKAGSSNPTTFEIAGRSATPGKLTESDSNGSIEHGTDYFIITPVSGLQYAYSTDGTNWTVLTDDDKDSSGRYYVKGLSANQVYISTRVIATETAPVSAWSEAATIILKTDAGSTTGTGVNTPKTGDENSLVLWGSILACGMAALGIVVVSRRKRQNIK